MARGKGKFRRNSSKSKVFNKTKRPQGKKNRSTNGRDIKHRDQVKRPFTEDVKVTVSKRPKIESRESVSDESEEEDSYQQLLSSFTNNDVKILAVESEEELDEERSEASETDPCSDFTLGTETSRTDTETDGPQSSGRRNGNTPISADRQESDNDSEYEKGVSHLQENSLPSVLRDDPFYAHICCNLSEDAVNVLSQTKPLSKQTEIRWKALGRLVVNIPQIINPLASDPIGQITLEEPKLYAQPGKVPEKLSDLNWNHLYVQPQLHKSIRKANHPNIDESNNTQCLTPLQYEVFTVLNNYQDLYFPERTLTNGEAVRLTYCLHVANHMLKTRNEILRHNAKLNKQGCLDVPEEFQDQGLVRPRVLILVPFREQARRVVEMLIKLLVPEGSKSAVMNKKRFDEEFSGQELIMPKKNPRPEDYETLFSGNTDDTFRLGLTLTKKCLKLYTDFYSSDIIISSPLGIRMIVGAEGEKQRDYDFLASIEILILDQADVFLMQNWDHLLHTMDHLHLQPRESHGTDFSRVRSWAVNGWAKYYRQTILFSSVALPECSALFNKRCKNYAGSVRVVNPINSGSVCHVIVQLPQVFQQIEAISVSQALDSRFNFFVKKVLPEHLDPLMSHTLIFVPSYFDFVRLRNFLRKEGHSFVQICEYSKDGKVARARDMFYHGQVQFLLYSERFHFFRRPRIKGIRHIVFYQPPTMPHFYSEMCNLMQESYQNPHGGSESNMTVTVLFSRFDAQQLAAIVGSERASRMINSDRNVHMFVTGE